MHAINKRAPFSLKATRLEKLENNNWPFYLMNFKRKNLVSFYARGVRHLIHILSFTYACTTSGYTYTISHYACIVRTQNVSLMAFQGTRPVCLSVERGYFVYLLYSSSFSRCVCKYFGYSWILNTAFSVVFRFRRKKKRRRIPFELQPSVPV